MPDSQTPSPRGAGSGAEPDVFLDVPELHVDQILLDVENLEAQLELRARLANLLELQAGAHASIEKVQLDITGVGAKALLKIRLENVLAILDRALTTIDRNPEVLQAVIRTGDDALSSGGAVGDAIEGASRTVYTPRRGRRVRVVRNVAAAVGVVGGAALAAQANGGIGKTFKQLTR